MKTQVLLYKASNEVITVVITVMALKFCRDACVSNSFAEVVWAQLLAEEIVSFTLRNQHRWRLTKFKQQFGCVVVLPSAAIFPQITTKCFVAPRALSKVANGRKRRHRAVVLLITQCHY